MGLIMLASTADCPSISAPTMPNVGPIAVGTRKLASRISSKENSIRIISKIIGNGTVSLDATIAKSNSVGNNS